MAISIKEMLGFPVFKDAILLAGQQGENKSIRWVNILEVLDDINRLEPDELLITTAFDLLSNEDVRKNLISNLADKRLAGIVIQTGYYLESIPQDLLDQGDRFGFPIIEIPRTTTFSEITKIVHKQIMHKQFEKIQYSEQMYKRLTDIALNNEGLQPILELIGSLIHGNICLFDTNLNELCYSHHLEYELAITKADMVAYLLQYREEFQKGILYSKQIELDEISLLCVPVRAKNHVYGYIVCMNTLDGFNEFEQIAIQHASTICALEFIKLSSLEEKDNKLKADFLELLLSGNYNDELTVYSKGEALGYKIGSHDTCVAIIQLDQFHKLKEPEKIQASIVQSVIKHLQEHGLETLVKLFHGHFVILLTNRWVQRVDITEVLEKTKEFVKTKFHQTLSIGIGNYYQDFNEYRNSYKEAQEAVFIIQSVWKENKCLHYRDLGLYKLLLPILQDVNMMKHYHQHVLGEILENEELLETLHTYLDNINKMNEVADKLFVHRHTLKYRIKKIEELTNKKIASFHDRMELELALIIHRTLQDQHSV